MEMEKNKINLLTLAEAAEESGINQETLASRIRNGSLRSYRRNGRVYLITQDITEWQPLWYNNHIDAIREAHAAGEPDVVMAAMLGISRERVRQLRTSIGLPLNPQKPRLPKAFAPGQPKTLLEVFSGNEN
jgi:hypothetical protein